MDIQYAIKPFNQNEIKYVHAVSELEYDASGKPYKILMCFSGCNRKKEGRYALLESERNYRDIFNTTSDALFIHEISTGDILDVNESMLKMYGYKGKEEIMHMTIADFSANLDDYSVEKLRLKFTKAIDEGPQVFEWLAKHKSGKLFWTEVSLSLTVIGGENRMIASCTRYNPPKRSPGKGPTPEKYICSCPGCNWRY
jgi:PAS domain S-box-containing protein